jgi:hypothetical protein
MSFIGTALTYQWYKGGLILYGLRDLIGSDLRWTQHSIILIKFGMRRATIPGKLGSRYRHLVAKTPDVMLYYLDDTWNKITLYENKAQNGRLQSPMAGYDVTIKFNAKLYADE